MKRAKVSELKNRLSHYLRLVRAGESVVVYDRDRAIARLEPLGDTAASDLDDWIPELERRGVLRRPSTRLPKQWLARRPRARADVLGALVEERETGR